ncbi:MAG: glycosyltransferase family 4 protein [Desulfobulbaceae bacterium]|nr:glycosyltransferase family 4 protein [Desulfobulbaceae bacterium]
MRILMVIERYIPIWGGAENQLRQLIPHLTHKGCKVEVVTRRWDNSLSALEQVDGIKVHRLGIPGTGVLPTVVFILSLFLFLLTKGRHFEIFHSHGVVNMGVLCRLACMVTGKVNVAKIATAGKIIPLQQGILGKILLNIFKKSDAIAAISKEIQEELYTVATKPDHIFATTNGVDCTRFHPPTQKEKIGLRNKNGFTEIDRIVLFSGRLVHRKGLDTLIKAWPEILKNIPKAHLVIVGSGRNQPDSIEEEMVKFKSDHQLANIHFMGETTRPEKFLALADIFAFPSRLEGFPNALMEAMASGLPTVATSIGGVTDLIKDNINGLLIPPDDHKQLAQKIISLLNDSNTAHSFGAQARQLMLKKYSFKSICADYFSLYERIINKK